MQYQIVTICGSTKFKDEMLKQAARLTLEGYIVLMPHVFSHAGDVITEEQKQRLDAMHFNKVGLSDIVFVVNVGGYIGTSTRKEIDHACALKKRLWFLEPA